MRPAGTVGWLEVFILLPYMRELGETIPIPGGQVTCYASVAYVEMASLGLSERDHALLGGRDAGH